MKSVQIFYPTNNIARTYNSIDVNSIEGAALNQTLNYAQQFHNNKKISYA